MHFTRSNRCRDSHCSMSMSLEWYKSFNFKEFNSDMRDKELQCESEQLRLDTIEKKKAAALERKPLNTHVDVQRLVRSFFGPPSAAVVDSAPSLGFAPHSSQIDIGNEIQSPEAAVAHKNAATSPIQKTPATHLFDRADESDDEGMAIRRRLLGGAKYNKPGIR